MTDKDKLVEVMEVLRGNIEPVKINTVQNQFTFDNRVGSVLLAEPDADLAQVMASLVRNDLEIDDDACRQAVIDGLVKVVVDQQYVSSPDEWDNEVPWWDLKNRHKYQALFVSPVYVLQQISP